MNPSDDSNSSHDQNHNSRRAFLQASGGWLGSAWMVAQWPAIAAAAHHAEQMPAQADAAHLQFFNAADAADVDAVCAQIVPSGTTPGAREARSFYFIDRSLATYFSEMAPAVTKGLGEFQTKFRATHPALESFAAAPSEVQTAFLKTVDRTPFFEMMRMLTVLGMFTSPKYGGNYQGFGWKLLGFLDQHAFAPPFGYYDAEYQGFVPYPGKHA
jgi:Gluconate 2-dehydrogenase subunit 3